MFKNQPKGLYVLALANTGERFGYYTMLAILLLFLQAKFALSTATAGVIYSTFLALVYFMPMIGGIIADKWNFQKTVTLGIIVMFIGYLVMAIPTTKGDGSAFSSPAFYIMLLALLLISCGTGLFKGNLQVMVGDLYDNPQYAHKRDVAFSLFYMAINIGAMFAPSVTEALCSTALSAQDLVYNADIPGLCNKFIGGDLTDAAGLAKLSDFFQTTDTATLMDQCKLYMQTISTGYSYAFAVACLSMVLSFLIYKLGRRTYNGVSDNKQKSTDGKTAAPELTKEQTKSRITALLLVFTVVIFFWMVFHQNGLTLTKFAETFTSSQATGATRIGFNIWALAVIVVAIYATFSLIQSSTNRSRIVSAIVLAASIAGIYLFYSNTPTVVEGLQPQIYQQFNPFFVVALTPFSVALFSWLGKKNMEPSAPRKIGYGMLVAGVGYIIMALGSMALGIPGENAADNGSISPNLLISTYLVLTFAELLLSPMGISFVSKVAPPKYKGAMMGCWFGATAIGNLLTAIPALLWDKIPVSLLWCILVCLCLLSAAFIFSIMKKLEAATND
jgi:POT family proton-dependent oligopeptide transporter